MPPSFFTSLAGKAQNALKDSSLSQHIPSSLTGAPRPSADSPPTADGGPTQKSHALGQIQHQLRQLQQTYSTTGPVQKIITAEKGVSLDFESLSRDAQAQSKELYMWGQHEEADVKDVSDRLAFLNFIAGSLSGTLAMKLNAARAPFKALRDDEVALTQRRNVRASLQNQIARLEHSQEKGSEKRIAEVKEQLAKAEKDDEPAERDHKVLLRKALKESEQEKFQALREYGEKLALLAQAADGILAVLPSAPPSPSQSYLGLETTGTIRASLQHSLDHWKPGQATLTAPAGAKLDRSHTQSFGVTHADELQKINTVERHITPQDPASPPLRGSLEGSARPTPAQDLGSTTTPPTTSESAKNSPVPVPTQYLGSTTIPPTASAKGKELPINPAVGDNEPVSNLSTAPSATVASPGPIDADSKVPSVTGESSSGAVPKRYESAEEEKQRLEREERERLLRGGGPSSGSSAPVYENSEEEKRRLEREEREKLLHGQTSGYGESNTHEGDTPPPYQDI
ncbi:Eisosome component PIL1-domain-containing protein [Lactarius akahatsu]|uniref:Eisosome component PIL1-domain-containing protein n=1 Tax=Lactarius akahatsu TaxID=416441 RepID=A0AAD4LEN6_9AGAM|nr:Eisosome component PIL1-domain-containing protein [Lactarius akahatsu]